MDSICSKIDSINLDSDSNSNWRIRKSSSEFKSTSKSHFFDPKFPYTYKPKNRNHERIESSVKIFKPTPKTIYVLDSDIITNTQKRLSDPKVYSDNINVIRKVLSIYLPRLKTISCPVGSWIRNKQLYVTPFITQKECPDTDPDFILKKITIPNCDLLQSNLDSISYRIKELQKLEKASRFRFNKEDPKSLEVILNRTRYDIELDRELSDYEQTNSYYKNVLNQYIKRMILIKSVLESNLELFQKVDSGLSYDGIFYSLPPTEASAIKIENVTLYILSHYAHMISEDMFHFLNLNIIRKEEKWINIKQGSETLRIKVFVLLLVGYKANEITSNLIRLTKDITKRDFLWVDETYFKSIEI